MTRQAKIRARAYIRVSKEREEMYSPETQLHAIRQYCMERGYLLVGEPVEDLDKTGRLWKSRQIEGLVQQIERKELDVIVVWKLSRVSRNRKDWNLAVDRVEGAGGRLESATERFDVSTPAGRFSRGMMAEFAAFESDNIGAVWKETHQRRLRNGKPATGKPRFGYQYVNKEFVPDPLEGPVLRQLYLDFTAGHTFRELGLSLKGQHGRVWGVTGLQRILDHGFGAGKLWTGGQLLQGTHEPVISEHEWEAYLASRNHRRSGPRAESTDYPYSGLLKCGVCGANLKGRTQGGARSYTCGSGDYHGDVHYLAVSERKVDVAVRKWLETVAEDVNQATKRHLGTQKPKIVAKSSILSRITAVDRKIDQLVLRSLDGGVPKDSYDRLMAGFEAEKKALGEALLEAKVASESPAEALVPDLLKHWPILPNRGKREVLKRLLARVEVSPHDPGKPRQIVPISKW